MSNIWQKHQGTILFCAGAIGMCLLLDWDKNAVKAFITGGAIAAWLTLRAIR